MDMTIPASQGGWDVLERIGELSNMRAGREVMVNLNLLNVPGMTRKQQGSFLIGLTRRGLAGCHYDDSGKKRLAAWPTKTGLAALSANGPRIAAPDLKNAIRRALPQAPTRRVRRGVGSY